MFPKLKMPALSNAALAVGLALAVYGALLGHATSATGTYGWLLRRWATCTGIGVMLLLLAAILGPKWTRRGAATLIACATLPGVDPARRLAAIGWFAP